MQRGQRLHVRRVRTTLDENLSITLVRDARDCAPVTRESGQKFLAFAHHDEINRQFPERRPRRRRAMRPDRYEYRRKIA